MNGLNTHCQKASSFTIDQLMEQMEDAWSANQGGIEPAEVLIIVRI
jgi:hypothetical protein